MPQAFGAFHQSPTLTCVCDGCNSYFGNELEAVLARDSAEALLRLRYGLRPSAASLRLLNRRVVMTIDQSGPWLGAQGFLSPTLSGEELEVLPFSQVGFRRPADTGWTWILEEELTTESVGPFHGSGVEVRIVGPDNDALERLSAAIQSHGITFKRSIRTDELMTGEDNSVQFAVEATLDMVIQRAVAKLAFNYSAWQLGSEFMRSTDFDEIRRVIRYGTSSSWKAVSISRKPILADDTNTQRQTNGHLCLVQWDKGQEGIRSRLSLFNEMTYDVALCRRYEGVWRDISVGHHFDPFSHRIHELTTTRFIKPPWSVQR